MKDEASSTASAVSTEPSVPPDLQLILHVDLLLDAVASHLALTTLTLLQRAAGSALLPKLKQVSLARRGVTASDVESGVHVLVLRHLIVSSVLEVITLPPAEYLLGSVADPLHVRHVRPAKPPFDESSQVRVVEWLHYVPEWRHGFGPLELLRSVTLRGETARGTIGERSVERPRLYFLDAPRSSGAVIAIGAGSLRIRVEGVDLYPCSEPLSCFYSGEAFRAEYHSALGLSTGGCVRCQAPEWRIGATCTCASFGGPTLEVSDCFVNGGFDLRGRSRFKRCRFMQPTVEAVRNPVPWHRLTIFEQMNNVRNESFGDRTVTVEPNGKFSIMCTVTSQAPGAVQKELGEGMEIAHDLIQNSWEEQRWPEEHHPCLREGPRRRLSTHELRGPLEDEVSDGRCDGGATSNAESGFIFVT
jgi:hypothetical protein